VKSKKKRQKKSNLTHTKKNTHTHIKSVTAGVLYISSTLHSLHSNNLNAYMSPNVPCIMILSFGDDVVHQTTYAPTAAQRGGGGGKKSEQHMSATDLLREWYAHHADLTAAETNNTSHRGTTSDYGSSRMASARSAFLVRRSQGSPRSRVACPSPSTMASPVNTARQTSGSGSAAQECPQDQFHTHSTDVTEASSLMHAPLALKEKGSQNSGLDQSGEHRTLLGERHNIRHRRGTPQRSLASYSASLRVRAAVATERRAKAEERLWLDAQLEVRKQREEELERARQERKHAARLMKKLHDTKKGSASHRSLGHQAPSSSSTAAAAVSGRQASPSPTHAGRAHDNKQRILGALRAFDVLPVERCGECSEDVPL
jgi:predicted nucleic acid-binding protein